MVQFAERVESYTSGLEQADFVADQMAFDATLRNLELIGEAAAHVPAEVRAAHRAVPWRELVATRNQLIQGYLGIDNDTIWSIVRDDVPALLVELRAIVDSATD